MKRFFNWLSNKISREQATPAANLDQSGAHPRPRRTQPRQVVPDRQPEFVEPGGRLKGRIEARGPGKNVLMRNKYVREDTGTHESLKILDESFIETDEAEGIDPYNTGGFDRSRNWERRRK